jgi:hypothetical protein
VQRRALWGHYQEADRAFERGLARVAWGVCAGINAARAPARQGVPAKEAVAH